MAKEVIYGEDVKKRLKKGVDTVANAVKITLGPRGRNVIIDKGFGDRVTAVIDSLNDESKAYLLPRITNQWTLIVSNNTAQLAMN